MTIPSLTYIARPCSTLREWVWDMATELSVAGTVEWVPITVQHSVTCYLKSVINWKISLNKNQNRECCKVTSPALVIIIPRSSIMTGLLTKFLSDNSLYCHVPTPSLSANEVWPCKTRLPTRPSSVAYINARNHDTSIV